MSVHSYMSGRALSRAAGQPTVEQLGLCFPSIFARRVCVAVGKSVGVRIAFFGADVCSLRGLDMKMEFRTGRSCGRRGKIGGAAGVAAGVAFAWLSAGYAAAPDSAGESSGQDSP